MSVGEWMGFPHQRIYREREAMYLRFEMEALEEICQHLETLETDPNLDIVVDTTGSVVYTGTSLLNRLRRNTMVVHLATSLAVQQQMLNGYIANMRPVLWNHYFEVKSNESVHDALARCYPRLLASREKLYKKYAHITIDHNVHSTRDADVHELLKVVRGR
jgi:shikimate kinase